MYGCWSEEMFGCLGEMFADQEKCLQLRERFFLLRRDFSWSGQIYSGQESYFLVRICGVCLGHIFAGQDRYFSLQEIIAGQKICLLVKIYLHTNMCS